MRIGEFAAASGVPVKTLRFYDELGLLRPAGRHPLTGYRDYAPTQLAQIAAIVALREVGVPLDDIKAALRADSPARRRALLEGTRRGLHRAIEEKSRSLAWVEIELRRLPDPSVTMRRRPPLRVASLRAQLGEYRDIVELERELLAVVPERLRGQGRGTLWHAHDDPALIDAEHFIEILAPPKRTQIAVQTLPAMSAACAFSRDDENAAIETFAAVRRWLETRGLRLVAAKREMYWPGMLEIQFPFALS
jgi:DNA-binding transcriptional MerR regulator